MSNPTKTITRQLFGTDGIRGVAGEYPLDRPTLLAIGRALGGRLKRNIDKPRVLLGQDTRESGQWIAESLAEGLSGAGVSFVSAGVVTTPGIAYLVREHGFDVGIVISASHNPWRDNGIKLFGSNGMKLADTIEHEIEQDIFTHLEALAGATPQHDFSASILPGEESLRQSYINWLLNNVDTTRFKDLRVLVDCAHGAATAIAPQLFEAMGLRASFAHTAPDGRNINRGCGALHPEKLSDLVRKKPGTYDLGVTFDGDADRSLFCDAAGNVIDGDAVLYLAALDMKARGLLRGDTVVATVMSNLGLEKALEREGIRLLRSNVGDRYVLEMMQDTGATLGGEQSGHILFLDGDSTTGDGILTALRIFDIVARTGNDIASLLKGFKVFPQVLVNVRVREKTPFKDVPEIHAAITEAERLLDGNGRALVRYSGTEKLARVMVEAENMELTTHCGESIADAIRKNLGTE